MARRKTRLLTGRRIRPLRQRIRRKRLEPARPLRLLGRDAVKSEVRARDTWWFTEHRRGVRQEKVGEDPLEARAIPESKVRGYLHERIVWRYLVANAKFSPDASGAPGSFDFQSSQFGGRQELGGLVVDFLFPYYKVGLEVEGPQHNTFIGGVRDEERRRLAALLGYRLVSLPIATIENVSEFENFMRRFLDILSGSGSAYYSASSIGYHEDDFNWEAIWLATLRLEQATDNAIVAVSAGG